MRSARNKNARFGLARSDNDIINNIKKSRLAIQTKFKLHIYNEKLFCFLYSQQ